VLSRNDVEVGGMRTRTGRALTLAPAHKHLDGAGGIAPNRSLHFTFSNIELQVAASCSPPACCPCFEKAWRRPRFLLPMTQGSPTDIVNGQSTRTFASRTF